MQETEKQVTPLPPISGEGWVAYVTDENHSIVQMPIPLAKGESVNLLLNVTSPDRALPGEVPFS
ncbi:MAG: hypothetical protein CM15mP71_1090 [Candidatus Poseidoniales archaeon]|nr:MAG: hypothetical protein CM15mP71_1090 [Candidatus Poseidoniales archaeon]